jgi:hypothetical protein
VAGAVALSDSFESQWPQAALAISGGFSLWLALGLAGQIMANNQLVDRARSGGV